MSTLTIEIEKEMPSLEPEAARRFEQEVRAMLRTARRKPEPETDKRDTLPTPLPYRTVPHPIGLKLGEASHKWTDLLDAVEGPDWK